MQGSAVACPLHGWVIELDTGRAEAPDEGCTRDGARCGVDGDRILLALPSCETDRRAALGSGMSERGRYPHDLPLLRRRLRADRRAPDGTIAGDPEHPANRGRLCSKGAALGETLDDRRPPAVPRDRRRQRGLGRGARPGRRHASRARSPSTGRTRSRSTSPASS